VGPLAPNSGGPGEGTASPAFCSPELGRGGILIRPARPEDLPTIIGLWRELQDINAAFDPRLMLNDESADWFIRYLGEQLENASSAILVAEHETRVVGYTFGQIMRRPTLASGDCGYIADICVGSQWRGRGIGRSLHGWLRAWFIAQGITATEVQVVRANPASQAFWRKMGYGDFLRTLRSEG